MDTRKEALAAAAGVNILGLSSFICHINELFGTESLDSNAYNHLMQNFKFCVSIQQKSLQKSMKGFVQNNCKKMAYISDELTLFPSQTLIIKDIIELQRDSLNI